MHDSLPNPSDPRKGVFELIFNRSKLPLEERVGGKLSGDGGSGAVAGYDVRFWRKGYWIQLALALAAAIACFHLATLASDKWWGYYGENWNDPLKLPHRLGSCAMQWLACVAYVNFCFLLMQKLRFGNKLLSLLGAATLSFYLMHGMFVDMFGYDFGGVAKSIVYIRNVPEYIAVVLACSVPATWLFHVLWKKLTWFSRPTAKESLTQ